MWVEDTSTFRAQGKGTVSFEEGPYEGNFLWVLCVSMSNWLWDTLLRECRKSQSPSSTRGCLDIVIWGTGSLPWNPIGWDLEVEGKCLLYHPQNMLMEFLSLSVACQMFPPTMRFWLLGVLRFSTTLSMSQFMDETDCGDAPGLGLPQCQVVSRLVLLPVDAYLWFWSFHTQMTCLIPGI